MVRLVISDNEGTTTVVPLVRDDISIGRKEGNTIRLTERNISRRHAQLVRVDGIHKLRDLDSYNGVLINGRRVQGESDVKTGDQIQIGDYTILVEEEIAKAPVEDAPTTISKRPVTPARLVMLSEPSSGAEFALPPDRVAKLGRAEDVDCPINHRSVSREHAEVRAENDGSYVIADLGSANGISVNGQVAKQHTLTSGDILELGQVVFRYIAPGEHYFFDPTEAARYRKGARAKRGASLKLAGIVLTAAAVVAVVIVMSGGDDTPKETATALKPKLASASGSAAAATLADDGYDKAVSACRAALSGARFAEAIAHATMALKVRPDAAEAGACKTQAQAQYEEEQAYVRGKAALQAGELEAAYQEFSRLSPTGPFASRPEVVDATAQLARARVSKAQAELSAGATSEATRVAQSVLALPAVPSASASAAQQILADARKAPAPSPPPTAARASAARPGHVFTPLAAREAPAPRPAAAAPAAASGVAMDVASACLARGDNECVIRALAGKANSAQELGLLIETYRATGDSKQAQKNMAIYVKRFPTARRADAYRRMLELQGQ
ncbi:MAG TPA: FHA domain-containing protein [Polyangiales bacterium]